MSNIREQLASYRPSNKEYQYFDRDHIHATQNLVAAEQTLSDSIKNAMKFEVKCTERKSITSYHLKNSQLVDFSLKGVDEQK